MRSIQRRSAAYVVFPLVAASLGILCRHGSWHGNAELHTLLETIAVVLEVSAGAIALRAYHVTGTPRYLLLGSGLAVAAWLDGCHALLTSSLLAGTIPAPLHALKASSEIAPRLFFALFLTFMAMKSKPQRPFWLVAQYGICALVGAFVLANWAGPAGVTISPVLRSWGSLYRIPDLIAASFFGVAAAAHSRRRIWISSGFEHWFILSLIANASGHLFFRVFSVESYDAPIVGFHLLKILSCALILVGLFSGFSTVYRSEADAVRQLRRINEELAEEIEERERAEEALRRSRDELEVRVRERTADLEEQSRQLQAAHAETELFLASIPSILIGLDSRGRVTRWNPTACAAFGISAEAALERPLDDCGVRWLGLDIRAEVSRWLLTESLYRCDELAYEKDGSVRSLGLSIRPIPASQTGASKILVTGADVTERRKAETALVHLAAVVECCDAAIITVDLKGRILSWNPAAERMYGYSGEEVRGCPTSFLWPPERWDQVADILGRLVAGERIEHTETVRIRKDGERIPILVTYSPIRDGSGKVVSACSIAVDITERKLLERQLAQAQKLESIGQLAAGIAHEINTPIQYVGDNIRFLRESFARLEQLFASYDRLLQSVRGQSPGSPLMADIERFSKAARLSYLRSEIPRSIEDSLDGAGRVAEIVRAIKEFSHPGPVEKIPLDINRAIESTVLVSRNEWKYVADLNTELDGNLPPVLCVPGEFNQVMLNLIVNAAHAIADVVADQPGMKGTITVSTERDGEWAEIRVQDTGTGIPEQVQPSIFNPFFTTKGVGQGTGQGLAIAHSVIVQKHGGTITFDTKLGAGTTFKIRLPVGTPEAGTAKGSHAEIALAADTTSEQRIPVERRER